MWDSANDGLGSSHVVTVWTSGGTQLLQATVPAGTIPALLDGFRYVPVTPTLLPAGDYLIGASFPIGTLDGLVYGAVITTAAGVTYNGPCVGPADGSSPPQLVTPGTGLFGPNFQFADTSSVSSPITIFNTGVDDSNALLAVGFTDPHYLLNGASTFVGANPVGTWIPNGPDSQWITPTTDASQALPVGTYTYTMVFTLPAAFTSATLSGVWAADDVATMSLNGGPTVSTTVHGFVDFTQFSITRGFVPGINTITFSVTNTVNPSPAGLRVEISGFFTTPLCTPDTWTTEAPSLQAVVAASGAVVNGQFYVIDGSGPGGKPPPQVYDPVANSWSYKAPDPIIRANASAAVINDKIYVAEGWLNADSNRATQALEIYDPATNTWTAGKQSTVARGGAASAVINGKLYLAGGSKNGSKVELKDLEIYDPVKDKWSSGAPMPMPTAGSGFALNGKFYVVGGFVRPANVNTGALQIYDPATNKWTTGPSMPTPRSGVMTAVINGKLYAIGGNNGVQLSNVEIYDPATNTWTTGTAEPTARYGGAAGVIGSKIYATGGYDASNLINGSLDVYTAVCP